MARPDLCTWRRGGAGARLWVTGGIVALVVAGPGCQCGDDALAPLVPAARPSAGADEPAGGDDSVPVDALPEGEVARSTDVVPMLTIEASVRSYRVTNRALVASWPPPERERLVRSARADWPDFPVLEISVPAAPDGPLLSRDLRDALARGLEAERARAERDVTPQAFALRAPATLAWGHVVRALFTAAMIGLTEPSFAVRTASGERRVRIARPDASTSGGSATGPVDLGEALARAVGSGGSTPEAPPAAPDEAPAPTAPAADPSTALAFSLAEEGLSVHRGGAALGPDCLAPSDDTSPAIALLALSDGHSLEGCLAVLGDGPASFRASAAVTHGTAMRVLAELAARGPVEIVMAGR